MTSVNYEIDMSLFNEIQPLCEYLKCVDPRRAADWIVYYDLREMCKCPTNREHVLFCDPCWRYRNSTGRTHCATCHKIYDAADNIIRVERL